LPPRLRAGNVCELRHLFSQPRSGNPAHTPSGRLHWADGAEKRPGAGSRQYYLQAAGWWKAEVPGLAGAGVGQGMERPRRDNSSCLKSPPRSRSAPCKGGAQKDRATGTPRGRRPWIEAARPPEILPADDTNAGISQPCSSRLDSLGSQKGCYLEVQADALSFLFALPKLKRCLAEMDETVLASCSLLGLIELGGRR
jgi:hypothetical protein